jgi:RNA polymerase sigma-70 factor (ECF subfamily)
LDSHAAQDAVQGFFAQLLDRHSFQGRTPDRGRFRSFLLASIQYYLADLRDREHAVKRGGGAVPISLDAPEAEGWYLLQPVDQLSPERIFERRWALTLVDRVLGRMESEFAASPRPELFRQLRPSLFDAEPGGSYDQLATSLQMTPGAVRVAAHRIRQRCRELFREEVAQTVEHPSEIEDELRYLRRVMAS